MICRYLFVFLLPSLIGLSYAYADEVTIEVVDAKGHFLAEAVIERVREREIDAKPALSELAVMDQINKSFVPEIIVIQQGQFVDFPNSDNIRHHVYSFSPTKTFELKLYADRPKKPIHFEEHGVVVLGCNIHDSMVGYIYVAADKQAQLTDENGQAQINIKADEMISVWHAHQEAGAEHRQLYKISELSRTDNGHLYRITIKTLPPQPRDTFQDSFRAISN